MVKHKITGLRRFSIKAITLNVFLGSLVLNFGSAYAQQTEGTDENADAAVQQKKDVDVIVVTAARTALPITALPLTVDIIDKEELDNQVSISGSTSDAISDLLPSFSPTRQKATLYGETLRGRVPLYAINGVPQSTPIRDSSRESFTIDPFFIDRVEVIYGSNALQGVGATGGVVNQVLIGAPKNEGITKRIQLQMASTGLGNSDAMGYKSAGLVSYREGDVDFTVGATYESRGVFIDGHDNLVGNDASQGDIQDSDSYSMFGRFGYQFSPSTSLEIVGNIYRLKGSDDYVRVTGDRALGIPATAIRGTTLGDTADNEAELLSAQLVNQDFAGGILTLQAFYSNTGFVFGGGVYSTFQDPEIDPTGNLVDQSANFSTKFGTKATYEKNVTNDLTVTIGLDVLDDTTSQELIQTDRYWVPETEFQSIAPFTQLNLNLLDDKLTLVGGLRWENVKLSIDDYTTIAVYGKNDVTGGTPTFDEVLPNAGIIYKPFSGLRAYASYTKGYTTPDVGRVTRAIDKPDVNLENYLDLTPIVSDNREIGIEFEHDIFTSTATFYRSESDFGQRLIPRGDEVIEVLREATEIKGFEVSLGIETPIDGLQLRVAYADVDGRVDTDGDTIVDADLSGTNIAPSRVNVSANYDNGGAFSAVLQSQFYLARSFDGQPEEADFEGYTVVNGLIRYRTDEYGTFNLAAQNILNEFYITYNSDTRASSDTSYYAGRGRSISLGWTAEF